MKERFSLGAYVAGSTPLAAVDARAKIAVLVAWTAVLFAAPGALSLACGAALLAVGLAAAHVAPAAVLRAARPALVVIALVFCANAVSCDGSGTVAVAGPVAVDPAGALRGAGFCARIVLLLGLALCLSASTTAPALADAFSRLLSPLSALHVPVGDVSMALSIALRFIPLVAEELDRVVLAQRARGVRFDEGGAVARVKRWASVVTPLAVGLLRRADVLAESMEARCYSGEVALDPRPLGARSWIVLLLGVTAAAGVCASSVLLVAG